LPQPSVSLAVVVQHHPKRARLLDTLLPALGECDVISDPEPDGPPSPIRTYLACLRAMPPWATHLLIVQDDVFIQSPHGFVQKVALKVAERPDSLVALFLAGAPARSARLAQQAHRRGQSWVLMAPNDWTPTVATVWPRVLARRFLAWCDDHPRLIKMGDDSVTGAWTTVENVPVWATVPSLVEHPDVEPSLIRRKAGAGKNRFRIAAVPPPGL